MSEVSILLSGLSRFGEGLEALETQLSRATYQARSSHSREHSLIQLFELLDLSVGALPIAALSALIDQPPADAGQTGDSPPVWLRVDPVHLRADLKHVFLFDSSHFSLDQEQARELRETLDEVFSARGMKLLGSLSSDHWYLQLPSLPEITTHTLSEVRGCDVLPFLPSGKAGGEWRTLHNEVQMSLHDCAVNQRRERLGEMPINAVWFWGQGGLPATPAQRWGRVIARDSLSEGLARHSGADFVAVSDSVGRIAELSRDVEQLLIVNPVATDLQGLEQDWILPLMSLLRRGRIRRLNILSEDAQFSLNRLALLRFWKRRRPLAALFPSPDSAGN